MKLLLINQYFWPDVASTSQMLFDLSQQLLSAGHEVHVLCSRGQYDPKNAPPDDPRNGSPENAAKLLPAYQVHRGVHIHRLRATGFGKKTMLGRVLDYLSFHASIGIHTLLTGWKYDAVVTLTTPPLVGLYGTPLTMFSRTKHICWVMDLHPDCEFELGVFSRRALVPRLLDWLNGLHFRHADANVVLGAYMKQRLIDKRVPARKIVSIPVWGLDEDSSSPEDDAQNPLRKELGLQGKFVLMYSGNAGLAHTFDVMCEAARRLQDDPQIVFLFVGGGQRMNEIKAYAQKHALPNVRIMGYFPREQLKHSLALGDVHLMSLRDGMAGVAVPSKLYGVMAMGRPSLFVGPAACETADTIRETGCGAVVGTQDVEGFIDAVRSMQRDTELRRAMGQRGRVAFVEQFSAAACGQQWRELIAAVGSSGELSHVERQADPARVQSATPVKPQRVAV